MLKHLLLKLQHTMNTLKWRETPNWKLSFSLELHLVSLEKDSFQWGVSLHFWAFVVRYDFRVGVWCTVFIQKVFRLQPFPIQFWILTQLEKIQFLLGNNFFAVYLETYGNKIPFLTVFVFCKIAIYEQR